MAFGKIAVGVLVAAVGVARVAVAAPATGPAATMPTTGPAVAADVAAMIAGLDADDFRDRDAAAAKLVARGDAVRPAVADAAAHADSPEVRARSAGVIATLDRLAAERPTAVTLHMADASPRDVIAALAKQGGMPLPVWPEQLWTPRFGGAIPRVTVDADGRPFWDVVADVCDKAGVCPRLMGPGGDVVLMQGSAGSLRCPRSVTPGRFLVVATGVQRMRSLTFGPNQPQPQASDAIRFALFADPKVPVLSAEMAPTLTEAVDDRGRSLVPPTDAGWRRQPNPFAGGHMIDFSAPLTLPDGGYRQIARLKGTLRLVVPSRVERVEVADVSSNAPSTHRAGPYTVRVEYCQVNDRVLICRAAVVTANEAEAAAVEHAVSGIRFEDANGQTITSRGGGPGMHRGDRVDVMANAVAADPIRLPVKLVWDAPVGPKEVEVAFEFHDLPLPQP